MSIMMVESTNFYPLSAKPLLFAATAVMITVI
jgi:hypothetical protein